MPRSAMPAMPASQLLPIVATGDHAAMRELIARFTPLVRSIARRFGHATEAADDVVQETMLRLWRGAGRFDPVRGSETTFVAAVARNVAIDMVRRQACRPAAPVAEPELAARPATGGPDVVADGVVDAITVRAALAELAAPQRELLRLTYFEQLSQTEIAVRLGIPVGTVKSRTFQAMAKLRALLREEPDGDRVRSAPAVRDLGCRRRRPAPHGRRRPARAVGTAGRAAELAAA